MSDLMPQVKVCKKCEIEKPITSFFKNKKMRDGHLSVCKLCTTKPSYRKRRKATLFLTTESKEKRRIQKLRWRKTNPIKHEAHVAIYRAVRTGKIKRGPCEKCGDPKTEAHHDDYMKKLDVRWLCKKHHFEIHNRVLGPNT